MEKSTAGRPGGVCDERDGAAVLDGNAVVSVLDAVVKRWDVCSAGRADAGGFGTSGSISTLSEETSGVGGRAKKPNAAVDANSEVVANIFARGLEMK
jgi:hypothetical protein